MAKIKSRDLIVPTKRLVNCMRLCLSDGPNAGLRKARSIRATSRITRARHSIPRSEYPFFNCPPRIDMKTIQILTLLSLAVASFAQETAPLEEARKIALKLESSLGTVSDAQVAIDPDTDRPTAVRAGDAGVMLVPDKKLSAANFTGAGAEITPVGQLWCYNVVLLDQGNRLAAEKLRYVTIANDGKEVDVQLFLLGVAKSSSGTPELVVFGRDKEALLRLPIIEAAGEKADVPFAVTVQKTGETTGTATIVVLGNYRFVMTVTKP